MKDRPKLDVLAGPGTPRRRGSVRRDGARLAHLEYALGEQLRFERFVTNVSARFACLSVENADEEITGAIQGIVEFLGVNRGSFAEFSSDKTILRVSHTYNRPDTPPTPRTVVNNELPWLTDKLLSGQDVILERIPEDLPPEAVRERKHFAAEGMRSGMAVPLKVGGKFAYALSVSSFKSHRKWPPALIARFRLLGEIFANAIERKRLEQAVDGQVRFERLVTDISARFAGLRIEDIDAEIYSALQQIAEFLRVDQTACLEFSSEQETLASTHFYSTPGVAAPPPPLILHTQFPWYTSKVCRGETIRYENLPDDLPPEAVNEREFVVATGMKSHLAIPINVGGTVAFVLAAVSFRFPRQWPDQMVPRLQLLGEMFVNALMRKRARKALLESEEKFRLLAETATCGIGIYQDGRFRYINPRAIEITGYPMDELLSMSVEQLVHPDFRALVAEHAQARLRGETLPARYEIRILTKRGDDRWVDFTSTAVQYKGQPAIIGTAFDITKRKQAEAYLQEVSGRLIQAQEEERSRIARELHDDLSQQLALLSIGLEELGQRTVEPTIKPDLASLSAQTKEIAAEVHQLSRELHPSQLGMLGLVAAVQSFCTEISRQKGLRVLFVYEGVPQALPSEVKLCLYRVVQEALQNVWKHSRAAQVRIELSGAPKALVLRVVDQGVGFDPGADATQAGLGLVSMRERVRLVNGRIAVYSAPGQGTHVEVRVPLPS